MDGDANVIHRVCYPLGLFFHPYYLLLSHLHYIIWEKNDDIIKGDKDNNKAILHLKTWFQNFG